MDGFLIADACGNYITVNPKACEILGYTQDELLQLNVRNLISPDEWQTVECNFAGLVAGQTLQMESCVHHANGSYIFVELQVKRLTAGRTQIFMREITERKCTEEALRISQARLQKVAANLPGVIYQLLLRPDGSQQMLYISSGCRELLELEPEAIQQDIDLLNSLTHPDDLQAFNDSGATSAHTLQPWHYEGRIITPSGKLKWIQGISHPERLAGGEILWDALLLDITQRKQAEEQLRQYQEHLEELVAERTASLQKANEQLSQEIAERQQVEVALRESEARFRAAAEGSLDAFFILQCLRDETGCIVDFTFADLNSNAEKMISMSKEEVIGKRLCELIPINLTAGFFEKYVRVVETQTVLEEEFPISTPEISATRLHHQVVPLPDGVAITSRDISECKSAEEALRESEEKYRLLFSRELDAIALFDVETGQFLDVNEAFLKLYGYTKEEALSLTPADVSAEPENTKTAIEKALLTGGDHICLRWHKKKDGTVFPVELCAGTFVWKGRTVMCAVLRDITERQQAQEALFKQKQTLRAILDNAPIWIWMTDTGGRMLLVNKTFCENVGVCEAQFLAAAHYNEILPEEESRACMASEAAAWAQDTPYHAEEILRFADGQRHTLEVIKTKIKDSSGTAIGLIGLGVDVTEHKQAQRELQQSETRFRELAQREALLNRMVNQIRNSLDIDTIVETALHEVRNLLCTNFTGLMWWRADACGWEVVRKANADSAFCELGLYTAEIVGSSVESLRRGETLRIDEVDTLNDPILKQFMLEMGYTSLLNVPFQTQSGEIGALSIVKCSNDSHPWTDSEVELIQAVANQLAIAIDQAELYKQSRLATAIAQAQTQQLEQTLRELKNTQAQLIQNEKMSSLGQMVAGVAHEINNPVSFIYGNVDFASHYFQDLLSLIELYQQEYPQPTPRIQEAISSIDLEFLVEDLQKLLGSIKLGAERIRNIVVSLRNFSRLNEVKLKPIDIHNGLDDTLLILQHRLRQQGKRPEIVVIKQYAQLPFVTCYASQLNQVFMNILSNAIDALQETHNQKETSDVPLTITIRTQAIDSDWVSIRIADNGCGMSEEVLSRIFDPFFTTKPVGSGTGLGLSISYSIVVDKHQGQLQCYSSPGQGAEFIISIPIRQRKTNSLAVV